VSVNEAAPRFQQRWRRLIRSRFRAEGQSDSISERIRIAIGSTARGDSGNGLLAVGVRIDSLAPEALRTLG
jgi:hypothetical protein